MKKTTMRPMMTSDFEAAAQNGEVDSAETGETEGGYRILIHRKALPPETFYLTSRRDKGSPRLFRNIDRMMAWLKARFKGRVTSTYLDDTASVKSRNRK